MLPEGLNIFISLFKATTIVSLIAVPDLMYDVTMITQQEMRPLPLYTGAALTYFVVVLIASSALRALSERWRAKIDRGSPERIPTNQEASRWDRYGSSVVADGKRQAGRQCGGGPLGPDEAAARE